MSDNMKHIGIVKHAYSTSGVPQRIDARDLFSEALDAETAGLLKKVGSGFTPTEAGLKLIDDARLVEVEE